MVQLPSAVGAPGEGAPGSGLAIGIRGRPLRTRMSISFQVGTLAKMDELVCKWQISRGVLIDKMTDILHRSVRSGKVRCCHGGDCPVNRTDVPEVF